MVNLENQAQVRVLVVGVGGGSSVNGIVNMLFLLGVVLCCWWWWWWCGVVLPAAV